MSFWRERTEPGTEEFVSIQVLRALAALVVVMVHIPTEITYGLKWGTPIPVVITGGAAADLFFVISGFVIVYACQPLFGQSDAPRIFLLRRLARVVPLYWLTSALILGVILLSYRDLATAVHSTGSVLASFAMISYPRPGGVIFPLNPPGWTMPYEMFFYAVFAGAILLSRTRAVLAVTLLFAVLVLIGRLVSLPQPFASWCDPVMFDFCFGMLVALVYRAGVRLPRAASYALLLAAMAAYAASATWGPYVEWRVLEWGVPGACVLAAFVLRPQPEAPGRLTRAFAFLGDASYSLYLTHYLVLPIPRRILSRIIEIPYMPWTLAVLLLVFAVLAAICVHLLFERPLTRMLYRWIGGLRAHPASAQLLPRATSPR
jgi:exopolysaccharide production protein ExoZ